MPVSKLFEYPTGSYLKLRLDYVLICGFDELEAMILRIVEMYVEKERLTLYQKHMNAEKKSPEEVIEITKDVWTSISHYLFMNDLYHIVKSENTLKRAIKSLIEKGFLCMKVTHGKHEATLYRLNIEAIETEFNTIERIGVKEYQKLMVSKTDTIKKRSHQKLIEDEGQELIPSDAPRVSKTDTLSRSNYEKNLEESKREIPVPPSSPSPSPAVSLSPLVTAATSSASATADEPEAPKGDDQPTDKIPALGRVQPPLSEPMEAVVPSRHTLKKEVVKNGVSTLPVYALEPSPSPISNAKSEEWTIERCIIVGNEERKASLPKSRRQEEYDTAEYLWQECSEREVRILLRYMKRYDSFWKHRKDVDIFKLKDHLPEIRERYDEWQEQQAQRNGNGHTPHGTVSGRPRISV